ncbi:MAG TPA: exodeoxyribonuclease VII large subunit [Anaerolineae bacterium]|nr:exodeoxyribonuclease VII large subunit [Anaerolineae bacterium]
MLPLWNQTGQAPSVWTVSALTTYIRELLETDFRLRELQIEGEISNFVAARSGHMYFTLKDGEAQLKCAMWRHAAGRLRFRPENGMAVVATGKIGVYEANGVYQLYVDEMEIAGQGDLAAQFEALKRKLEEEGLFDVERKQPIPPVPRKIGIVTSANAAALQDILNVLRRRYPLVEVLIAPTLVQGKEAPAQIIRALQWLDGRDDIDTIIVARGGGSIEDLWAFNDEGVARAVAGAHHPVITGVGHEIDFTIVDFVSDLRAPTPSAAAELAVPDLSELRQAWAGLAGALPVLMARRLVAARNELATYQRALRHLSPKQRLLNNRQTVDQWQERLERGMGQFLVAREQRLAVLAAGLMGVSPLATLARGYAIVRDEGGRVVRDVGMVSEGDVLGVDVANGRLQVTVNQIEEKNKDG